MSAGIKEQAGTHIPSWGSMIVILGIDLGRSLHQAMRKIYPELLIKIRMGSRCRLETISITSSYSRCQKKGLIDKPFTK